MKRLWIAGFLALLGTGVLVFRFAQSVESTKAHRESAEVRRELEQMSEELATARKQLATGQADCDSQWMTGMVRSLETSAPNSQLSPHIASANSPYDAVEAQSERDFDPTAQLQ